MENDADGVAQKLEQQAEGGSQTKEEVVASTSGKQQVLVQNNESEFSAQDLHGNDTKILSLLNEEEGSNYSFKGMMRKLHIHQQSLARALHRLEEMGLVERSQVGYRLSKVGETMVAARATTRRSIIAVPKGREYMQLLQTYIPVDIRPAEIVRALVGKWFRNLRWVGLIESGTGFTLQWASDDGSFQINLRMISDYVVIETNAASQKEKLQAMVGSYAIYEQITKILQDRLAPANAYVLHRPALHQQNN
ncbi:MarR family regulator [Candidatus Nitrososphaera evergladensis SR1]|uniref:MarR family regulator n=1 Tax=Candidatus Nitrososphaera evergladensis SR1 TaxID=1459636 RepID=A0A075MXM5_9ARCH|nr:MarR family transcriptional regulator [Candidatus Nitrososphaera evergladensis]AIF85362.1 MarR family regulator [Candidatus Nitrososphaera evergladensis SR1]